MSGTTGWSFPTIRDSVEAGTIGHRDGVEAVPYDCKRNVKNDRLAASPGSEANGSLAKFLFRD